MNGPVQAMKRNETILDAQLATMDTTVSNFVQQIPNIVNSHATSFSNSPLSTFQIIVNTWVQFNLIPNIYGRIINPLDLGIVEFFTYYSSCVFAVNDECSLMNAICILIVPSLDILCFVLFAGVIIIGILMLLDGIMTLFVGGGKHKAQVLYSRFREKGPTRGGFSALWSKYRKPKEKKARLFEDDEPSRPPPKSYSSDEESKTSARPPTYSSHKSSDDEPSYAPRPSYVPPSRYESDSDDNSRKKKKKKGFFSRTKDKIKGSSKKDKKYGGYA